MATIKSTIHLASVEQVKEFTAAMMDFKFPVDLSRGRYNVNGKSIMGIFSLDLGQPISISADVPEEQEEQFLKILTRYAV